MPKTTLSNALDGAELVVVDDSGFTDVIAVWHGGTTFNVYVPTGDPDEPLDERTCFSVSDGNGEPLGREAAEEHAREWLAETLAEQR